VACWLAVRRVGEQQVAGLVAELLHLDEQVA
jgi:hypothetical protein